MATADKTASAASMKNPVIRRRGVKHSRGRPLAIDTVHIDINLERRLLLITSKDLLPDYGVFGGGRLAGKLNQMTTDACRRTRGELDVEAGAAS